MHMCREILECRLILINRVYKNMPWTLKLSSAVQNLVIATIKRKDTQFVARAQKRLSIESKI